MENAKRDVALLVIGAAAAVVVMSAIRFVAPTVRPRGSESPESTTADAPSRGAEERRAEAPSAADPGSSVEAEVRGDRRGGDELKQVRLELQDLRAQRSRLQESLRAVEKELKKQEQPPAYDYDLTRVQWKELAATGRIKYRVPCQNSAREGWTIGAPILDALGLRLEDREPIMEALWRSNARMWGAIKPMCAELVAEEDVVELLGFDGCSVLIEQAARKKDSMATYEAQRLVAEVRAGMRAAPTREEAPSHLYQLFMAVTGEGELFEADLAQTFGPEDAQRIWHEFPCSKYSR